MLCVKAERNKLLRTLTVALKYHPKFTVTQLFAQCLKSLPNLRTLKIVTFNLLQGDLQREFTRKTCPQITILMLPSPAYPILDSCSGLRAVHLMRWGYLREAFLAIATNCPSVERITGVDGQEHKLLLGAWSSNTERGGLQCSYSALLDQFERTRHFARVKMLLALTTPK